MTWLRLHTDILSNPKLLALSETIQLRCIKLWCLQKEGVLKDVTERYGSNAEETLRIIAAALRVTDEDLHETQKELIKFGLIDENWTIHNWEKRQFISDCKDKTNAERQRRYREKNKRYSNGEVTHQNTDNRGNNITNVTLLPTLVRKREKIEYSNDFLELFKIYPSNGDSKKNSNTAYLKTLAKGFTHEEIITGATNYANYIERNPEKKSFILHLSRWLSREQFTVHYECLNLNVSNQKYESGAKHTATVSAESIIAERAAARIRLEGIANQDHP